MARAARFVTEPRLRSSAAPVAELAAAAMEAQRAAGLERTDFIVIAVDPGRGAHELGRLGVENDIAGASPAPASAS